MPLSPPLAFEKQLSGHRARKKRKAPKLLIESYLYVGSGYLNAE